MNISTLAKVLGISINELREVGMKNRIYGFNNRNTRVNYNAAVEITKILKPNKISILKNDDRMYIPASLTVSEFAETINKPVGMVVKTLLLNGIMCTINEKIDYDTATLIAEELGVKVYPESEELASMISNSEDLLMIKTFNENQVDDNSQGTKTNRPPIVTVMGHVDHGKTTLLDTIRKSDIVGKEAGAITQHLNSYQIEHVTDNVINPSNLVKGKKGYKITFVDTPGHEAFISMRARGTQLADIIILMVSATEGCKPQTIEVIERAKMTKTPVIVAVNKIDLPTADLEKVKQEVATFGLVPEEWGGDTPFIPISAKNNINIDKLLDAIILYSEVNNYQGLVGVNGEGVVLEAVIEPKTGPQASILVIKNKLKVGDIITCSGIVGKIKRIINSDHKGIMEGGLAEPVTVYGLPDIAKIGDQIKVFKSVKDANNYLTIENNKKVHKKTIVHNKEIDPHALNIILKTDVSGSLEALKESILKIPTEDATIVIKAESVGHINDNDIDFAKTTNSTILAFHTTVSPTALATIKSKKVDLIESDIIYEILEWVEEQILKRIKHETRIDVLGSANILGIFKSEKATTQIFGGEVTNGKLLNGKLYRIMRDNQEVGRIEVKELQKNKVKVSEVNISQQFGASGTGKTKILKGDVLECFNETIIKKNQ